MISAASSGSFKNTEAFLRAMNKMDVRTVLRKYGAEGVRALSNATPTETALAARSWDFEVTQKGSVYTITWLNSDIESGFPVAIMLQYGYGTGTGGYIQGRDYINPALQPIFDRIANEVWKVVTAA